ncbi:MAG: hypothetical protein O2931_03755 [Planctomycetota bacterium]|nr:hypothetical protein [Planctomycetota bacterium]MDA1177893.1 hypothetical protein [Planctomycetota bacterium]
MTSFLFDPMCSAILLVAVGVLVSHALWYVYGGDQTQLANELRQLKESSSRLGNSVQRGNSSPPATSLRPAVKRSAPPAGNFSPPDQLPWAQRLEHLQHAQTATQDELRRERELRVKIERDLLAKQEQLMKVAEHVRGIDALKKHGKTLKSALTYSEQELAQLQKIRNDSESSLRNTNQRVVELEARLATEQQAVQQLRQEREETIRLWQQERHQIGSLRHDLQQRDQTIVQLREQTDHLRQERVTLQQALNQNQDQLNATSRERTDAERIRRESHEQLQQLESQLREHQATIHRVDQSRQETLAKWEEERSRRTRLLERLEAIRANHQHEISALRQAHFSVSHALQHSEGLLGNERDSIKAIEQQLQNSHEVVKRLKSEIEKHQTRLDELQQSKEKVLKTWQQEREARQLLEKEKLANQNQISKLTQRADLVEPLESQISEMQQRIESYVDEVNRYQAEREQGLAVVTRQDLRITHLGDELDQQRIELQNLQEINEQLKQELVESQKASAEFERQLEAMSTALQDERQRRTVAEASLRRVETLLQERHSEVEHLAFDLREAAHLRQRLESQIGQTNESLEAAHQAADLSNERIRELEEASREALERLQHVERDKEQVANELQALQTRRVRLSDAMRVALDAEEPRELSLAAEPYGSLDPVLGPLYTRPPRQKDDLQRIVGITEVLEGRLNELGVYRFEQIMAWTDQNIDAFSNLLSFKDRIRRDQWVEQARALHGESNVQGRAA